MWVRGKIGGSAGKIFEMPYDVAVQNLAIETVEAVTPEEVRAYGLEPEKVLEVDPQKLLEGYHFRPGENGGYEVLDSGGVMLHPVEKPFHNLMAAREFAVNHSASTKHVVPAESVEFPRKLVDAVKIPKNWEDSHGMTKKKLARDISGEDPKSLPEAEAIIAAEVERQNAVGIVDKADAKRVDEMAKAADKSADPAR